MCNRAEIEPEIGFVKGAHKQARKLAKARRKREEAGGVLTSSSKAGPIAGSLFLTG